MRKVSDGELYWLMISGSSIFSEKKPEMCGSVCSICILPPLSTGLMHLTTLIVLIVLRSALEQGHTHHVVQTMNWNSWKKKNRAKRKRTKMHKCVVHQLFMCERVNPGASPVLMSHWVAYEVLGSAQESFLMQVQVSSKCLLMCHSDLSAVPPVRECQPSFQLFPYFRSPRMALETGPHGSRHVCT